MLVLINWKNLADKKKDLAVLISILMYKMVYLASKTFLTITDEEIDSIQNELAKKKKRLFTHYMQLSFEGRYCQEKEQMPGYQI